MSDVVERARAFVERLNVRNPGPAEVREIIHSLVKEIELLRSGYAEWNPT